jgi:hypothetical protein
MHGGSQPTTSEGVPTSSRLRVGPIREEDLPDVAAFLGKHYPPDTSQEEWAEAWRTTVNLPGSQAPNHGMLLRADDEIVGAYPAIYSTRIIDGRPERFCNLAVWCVAPEHRVGAMRMLKAILAQEGFHFTDLTPIETVQRLNLRLGFEYLKTDTALIPNLPWPTLPRRIKISSDPTVIDAALRGQARRVYHDHARCRWARHLVLIKGDEACYVQWRVERRKGLPWFSSIRYASNPELLRRSFRALARHLLLHHRVPFSLVEVRVAGGRIQPSRLLPDLYRRMFKSATLRPDQIDYLYSEITSAP